MSYNELYKQTHTYTERERERLDTFTRLKNNIKY